MTTEILNAKTNIYFEALSDIPQNALEYVFNQAIANETNFPRPKVLLNYYESYRLASESWVQSQKKSMQWMEAEKERREHPERFPTQEQHEGAIKVIMAVLDGRLTMDRGEEVMAGVLSGEIG